ncbi:MAG: cadherin repeat domain-containing protein, partial [Bacteroidota bacterium]
MLLRKRICSILPASGPFDIGENAGNTDAVGTINLATDADVPADTITYAITGGTGAALFNIDNAGNITVNGNGNFDFESGVSSYTIDIVANDGTIDSNTETITINILDENDAPILPASGPFSIGENSGDTTAVGTVNVATDQDMPADTITYSITGGTGAALFNIDN